MADMALGQAVADKLPACPRYAVLDRLPAADKSQDRLVADKRPAAASRHLDFAPTLAADKWPLPQQGSEHTADNWAAPQWAVELPNSGFLG
jgi:hypothetical protein